MNRGVIIVGSAISLFAAAHAVLWPQGPTDEKHSKETGIDGVWTELFREHAGKLESSQPVRKVKPDPSDPKVNRLWKISKDKIEKGPDDASFPTERWNCKLHPAGKPGELDGVLLDKNGKENPEQKWKGIYQIKGDYLIVCFNLDDPPVRPEKLATSAKSNGTFLFILRRGKLK
jgi:uncharacterized protein (TIGR03067 family)